MDLGRWNIGHLGRFLGDVLDGDIEIKGAASEEVRDAFDVSEDTKALDRALSLLRPGAPTEKILNAFAPFFEGGLALKIVNGQTRLTNLFLFGQAFTPPDSKGQSVFFGIGSMDTNRVYRASIGPILKALDLNSFFRLDGACAFAFPVSKDTIFIIFDNRPHPWQVFAIENAYLAAREAYARLSIKPQAASARGFFK